LTRLRVVFGFAVGQGFYPGVAGATAMAETLYGLSNRFSKLPYTLLGEAFTEESVMNDMSMTDPPGRGYRYYTGKNTILPFGFGAPPPCSMPMVL